MSTVPDEAGECDGREGDRFGTSLTWDERLRHGETMDPCLQGELTATIPLVDADRGSECFAAHQSLRPGSPDEDDDRGSGMASGELLALAGER